MVKKDHFLDMMRYGFPNMTICEERIRFFDNAVEACEGSQVIAVATEWDEFKEVDYKQCYKVMQKPSYIFDGRVLLDGEAMNEIGFQYLCIGKNKL